jgi:hypothetical protein
MPRMHCHRPAPHAGAHHDRRPSYPPLLPLALLPPRQEFISTLRVPALDPALAAAALAAPPPAFELLTVADLLPPDAAHEYEARFAG